MGTPVLSATQGIVILLIVPVIAFAVAVLLRKKAFPEKSMWNCTLSIILIPFRILKTGPFKRDITLENAMKFAMKKTNLNDFGDLTFADSYSVVMDGAAQNKLRYHNIGYIMAQLELNNTMERRLLFIDYLKKTPEVLKIQVNKPVFVVGLPRTGTTFLHRLLSLDPTVRAPLLWELLSPVPRVGGGAKQEEFAADSAKRAGYMKKLLQKRKDAGDSALEHIHEIGYDVPEECLISMSDELPCLTQHFYSVYMDLPLFLDKIGSEAVRNAYHYHKKTLQLLAYQAGDAASKKTWMLKSPMHLFYIKELAAAFPDATIIW
jgi:hypothetical protein